MLSRRSPPLVPSRRPPGPDRTPTAGRLRRPPPARATAPSHRPPPASATGRQDENNLLEDTLDDPSEPINLPLSFLKYITKNFSRHQCIGRGGFAAVYKGQLRNGRVIAVKKLFENPEIDEKEFQREVGCLMRAKHKNIVRFLGYCYNTEKIMVKYGGKDVMADERKMLLCFEFLGKGSLYEYINDASSCGLKWHNIYDIIREVCDGLHYLHTEHNSQSEHNIIHMDLTPKNILLDDNMVPKIADFGTSRFIDQNKSQIITLNPVGTRGYMAPEYINEGKASKKADIYSLGIIILELLAGPRSKYFSNRNDESLALLINQINGKWKDVSPNADYNIQQQQAATCLSIGLECIDNDPHKRPSIKDIIERLDRFLCKRETENNEVQDTTSSWSLVEAISNDVAVGVMALVIIILSPSWLCSCVIMALKVITALVTLLVKASLCVVGSSWPLVLLTLKVCSWVVMALKVITTLVTLLIKTPFCVVGSLWSLALKVLLAVVTLLIEVANLL